MPSFAKINMYVCVYIHMCVYNNYIHIYVYIIIIYIYMYIYTHVYQN